MEISLGISLSWSFLNGGEAVDLTRPIDLTDPADTPDPFYPPSETISIGTISTADPDWLRDAALTGGADDMYYVDFDFAAPIDGSPVGFIKRARATADLLDFGSPVTVLTNATTGAIYDNYETPAAIAFGGAVFLYALGYDYDANGFHTPSALDSIVLAFGDGTDFAWGGPVLAAGNVAEDATWIMEPCAIADGGDVRVFYTGVTNLVGASICTAAAADGFTFLNHAAVLTPATAPAGAVYHGFASPDVIQMPDSRYLMAFTGLNSSVQNAGGIGLAVADSLTGPWTAGPDFAFMPIAPTVEITGAAMRIIGTDLHVLCSAVQDGTGQILAQEYRKPLSVALADAGIVLGPLQALAPDGP